MIKGLMLNKFFIKIVTRLLFMVFNFPQLVSNQYVGA